MAVEQQDKKKVSQKKTRGPQNGKEPQNRWKRKNLTLVLVMSLVVLLLLKWTDNQGAEQELTYTDFKAIMANPESQIKDVKLLRNNEGYLLTAKGPVSSGEQQGSLEVQSEEKVYRVQLPFSDEIHIMMDDLTAKGVNVSYAKDSAWKGWIGSLLPLILIIGFVWFMMSRQSQAGGGRGLFSFGKSNAKMSDPENPDITFKNVAGADEAKQELQEIVDFLKSPQKYDRLGGKIPKGALLLGPPGTGKTLLAKAVSGEAGVPFFSMSGSDFVEMFVGVGASRVRDLFTQGKKNAPCIVFIDEIDAVGRHRGAGLGGGHDEREQTLNQLLVEMDGFGASDGIIIIAATNRPDVLDPALLRPGRFDRQIVVDAPDAKGREGILKVHLEKRKIPLADDVDTYTIAKGTPGLVGADLENLVNEACLMAARFNNKKVSMIDFEEAKDKIMIGTERVSRILGEEEKKTTAYHEAGHALITNYMTHKDPLHKVTIIPRGRALGITFSLPEKDHYTMSANYVLEKIAILMGGREAEILMFDQKNTGASNDIEVATDLARKYVCQWGMSDALGPLAYAKPQGEVFLGKDMSQNQQYSEATAQKIDQEVRKIIDEQSEKVKNLLREHKQELINLAEALLEHETLEGEEITRAIAGEAVGATRKSRTYIRYEEQKQQLSVDSSSEVQETHSIPSVDVATSQKIHEGEGANKQEGTVRRGSDNGASLDTSA
jgi:cell division protease FtsH